MILKALFNTSQVDDFAKSLANTFSQRFPPNPAQHPQKGIDKKLVTALQHLNQQAMDFNRQHKIGIYKKAKLSNTLKWELKEKGYHDDLINEIIKTMLMAMARTK